MAGRPIDEKIVAMKMDISDFKRKAMETTGLFGKLKDTFSKVATGNGMAKVTQELGKIKGAAANVDLSRLATAAETVSGRFSSMGVVATTALVNITNKAVNAGAALAKSLTSDPIMDGFREYELKIGSIGTMLSNTKWDGSTLTDVKKTLSELNDYADKTIYSFGTMTENIGRFTAAGVTLEDSAIAIKGLGNLAATSGSTVDQLNTAMYQSSQALASGKLNLEDWNSLVNAGMAGKTTQDALVKTAKAMGKNVDMSDGFRASIQDGWLTSEVFLKTLKKFGEDESMTEAATSVRTLSGMLDTLKEGIGSGWATTWELMFGDFEVATKRWTALSQMVGGFFQKSTDARNKFVKGLADAGVFDTIFGILTDTGGTIMKVFGSITDGIGNAFKAISLGGIVGSFSKMVSGIKNFVAGLKPSEATLEKISKVAEALFSVLLMVAGAAWSLAKALVGMIPPGLGTLALGVLSGFASMVIAFTESMFAAENLSKASSGLSKVFGYLGAGLGKLIEAFSSLGEAISGAWDILTTGSVDIKGPWDEDSRITEWMLRIRGAFVGLAEFFKAIDFSAMFAPILAGMKNFGTYLASMGFSIAPLTNAFGRFFDALGSGFDWIGQQLPGLASALNSSVPESIGKIGAAMSGMTVSLEPVKNAFKSFFDVIVSGFNWLIDKLPDVGGSIKNTMPEDMVSMADILTPVAAAFGSFFDLIGRGYDWLKDKLAMVRDSIAEAMPSGNKLLAGGFMAGLVVISGMAIKMFYGLYKVFTGWGGIGEGITGVLESTGDALGAFTTGIQARSILTIAIALGILAISFLVLSRLNGEQIGNGLIMIVGSLMAVVGAMAIMTKYDIAGQGLKTAVTLVGLAVAFAILSTALHRIADLSWSEIGKGIVGLVGILGSLSIAIAVMGRFGGAKVGASALQIIAISTAIHILLSAIQRISKISAGALTKGVVVVTIILAQLAIFMAVVSGSKFGIGSTLGMLAVGQAIENMVSAIERIAEVDTKELIVGLAVITLILAEIAIFTKVTSGGGLLSSGVGMLIVAAAISALIIPIAILGNMDMKTLAKGLGAMAVALVAIGLASKLMTGLIAAGAGLILIAAGLTLLLIPLTAFAAMGWGGMLLGMTGLALALGIIGVAAFLLTPVIPVLVAFGLGILAMGAGMALAGVGMALFSTGLVTLATMTAGAITTIVAVMGTLIVGLASLIPTVIEFIVKLVLQIAQAIATNAPIIATRIAETILGILTTITTFIPQFIAKGTELITNFLTGMSTAIPQLVDAAMNFMIDIVNGMATAIRENGPAIIQAMTGLMTEIAIIIIQAGAAMINGVLGWIPGVTEATENMSSSAEAALRANLDTGSVGAEKGTDFAGALGGKSGAASSAGTTLANAGKTGAGSTNYLSVGAAKGTDFSQALANKTGASSSAGSTLANAGKIGAGNPNYGVVGTSQGGEFATGLAGKSGSASTAGTTIANAGKSGASSVSMNSAGTNFGSGFASGISGSYEKVKNAAKSLAQSASKAVEKWLHIASPSKLMRQDGGHFGEGLALGISDKTKRVTNSAKGLAMDATDSLNRFLGGFSLEGLDNEIHFRAVIDYDQLDVSRFGGINTLGITPSMATTSGLIPASLPSIAMVNAPNSQNADNTAMLDRQDKQLDMLQRQVDLLGNIAAKDTSTYLDGKELYNNNQKIQESQTSIRNIFKGVSMT